MHPSYGLFSLVRVGLDGSLTAYPPALTRPSRVTVPPVASEAGDAV